MSQRMIFLVGFLVCTGLVAASLYFQYVMHLEPCPLCILQRVLVIGVGLILLAGALHNPGKWGRRIYGGLVALVAGAGAGVAGRHLWLQLLPLDQQPGCSSYDLDYMLQTFPLFKTLKLVLAGTGGCGEITWTFLGLTMPGWVLIFFVGLIVLGLMLVFTSFGKR